MSAPCEATEKCTNSLRHVLLLRAEAVDAKDFTIDVTSGDARRVRRVWRDEEIKGHGFLIQISFDAFVHDRYSHVHKINRRGQVCELPFEAANIHRVNKVIEVPPRGVWDPNSDDVVDVS